MTGGSDNLHLNRSYDQYPKWRGSGQTNQSALIWKWNWGLGQQAVPAFRSRQCCSVNGVALFLGAAAYYVRGSDRL